MKEIFYLKKFFSKFNNIFDLPDQNKDIKTGWLAYPIILKDKLKFQRKDLQIYLEKRNIQTRTIFTGNIF